MPGVLECAMKDRYDVRKEAAWCIANFFSGGNNAQCLYLLQIDAFVPLLRMLDNPDTSLVDLSLDGIERALKIGDANKDGTNVFVSKIEEFEGEKLLLRLAQEHDNAHIVEKANRILAMFFPVWFLCSQFLIPSRIANIWKMYTERGRVRTDSDRRRQLLCFLENSGAHFRVYISNINKPKYHFCLRSTM
jgi:hypothetical protein